jgi:hypothetical protein
MTNPIAHDIGDAASVDLTQDRPTVRDFVRLFCAAAR